MLCLRTTEFDVEAHPYSQEHLHHLRSLWQKKKKQKGGRVGTPTLAVCDLTEGMDTSVKDARLAAGGHKS